MFKNITKIKNFQKSFAKFKKILKKVSKILKNIKILKKKGLIKRQNPLKGTS